MTTTPLTIIEAARSLGVSTKTMRRLIDQKRIGSIRYTPKGKVYVDPEELDRFQNGCRTNPTPPKSKPVVRRLSGLTPARSEWGSE